MLLSVRLLNGVWCSSTYLDFYTKKISFNKGKIKACLDKQKLRESIASRTALAITLKGVLPKKEKNGLRGAQGSKKGKEPRKRNSVNMYRSTLIL